MRSRTAHLLCLSLMLPALLATQGSTAAGEDRIEQGRRIYLDGVLPSGAALTASRLGSPTLSGAPIACVNCHRNSGMGQVEGDIAVPPIAGNFLFATDKDKRLATMDPRVSKRFNQAHEAYTDASLSDAIVRGINNRGQQMNPAMPRFNLDEQQLNALTAYLTQLSSQWSPGASDSSIRFAMVITPDVDPSRRQALIDMMRKILRQKNSSTVIANKPGAIRHHMASAAELVLGTERNWALDIWELEGDIKTWDAQLEAHYRSRPVFALVSGRSESGWQTVQDFCEREHIPSWFPSVDLPPEHPSRYTFYFSRGVRLEADVLARHLLDRPARPSRLVQVFRDDETARAASEELARALIGSKIAVETIVLRQDKHPADSLRAALHRVKPGAAAMFWLRPDDIAALGGTKPVSGYFSALLAKAEQHPFPAEWQSRARLVYPYALPEKRAINLAYFHAWMNINRQPVVDEAMQSEVFFAMNFLTDTLSEMLDNLYRDYLVERAEIMLSKREIGKAEQETRDRVALGRLGDLQKKHGTPTIAEGQRIAVTAQPDLGSIEHGTTIYPHLSLGAGQRFASKGGYIVRFAGDNSLVAESDWIVP